MHNLLFIYYLNNKTKLIIYLLFKININYQSNETKEYLINEQSSII